jgi:hypothetical protein
MRGGHRINVAPGDTYGELTVIRELGRIDGFRRVECQCSCGKLKIVSIYLLQRKHVKSCGCLVHKGHVKHGQYQTAEWQSWKAMRGRCNNSNNPFFHYYGGRGIIVCPSWDSFTQFLADMGAKPTPQHSLDRIDVDGNYCPENCRWATKVEQENNRTDNTFVVFEGNRLTIAQWSHSLGFPRGLLSKRLIRGWPIARALTTPVQRRLSKCAL